MLYQQLSKAEYEKLGLKDEDVVEKLASMRPEAKSPMKAKYSVVVDFTGVSAERLREFAAQKLVISFANGNRKSFYEIEKAAQEGKTIILLKASTIGQRAVVEISPEKAISKIRTPEAAQRAVEAAMQHYQTLLKAAGIPASEILKKLSSFKDAK